MDFNFGSISSPLKRKAFVGLSTGTMATAEVASVSLEMSDWVQIYLHLLMLQNTSGQCVDNMGWIGS